MAASSRQSSSRKRPAELDESADQSPIVQLSFAQLCGCDVCWRQVPLRPIYRHSARLRAKKLKQAKRPAALDHEREAPKNFFVYEGYELNHHLGCSTDGRYMYAYTKQVDVLVVDLLRNAYKLWKSPTKWFCRVIMGEIVVVSSHAILAKAHNYGNGGTNELHLIRLSDDGDVYERTLLHASRGRGRGLTFVLTEITGEEVDVKRAVLGYSGELVFLRLNLNEPHATVQHTAIHPELMDFFAQMSENGTRLYTIDSRTPKELHVYALEEQKWTKEELGGVEPSPSYFWGSWSGQHFLFAQGNQRINGVQHRFLSRCNFAARKWEAIPFCTPPRAQLFPIVNPMDDENDGFVGVEQTSSWPNGHRVTRFKVERFMYRNPDLLRNLSVMVAHKSREEIDGEGGFQHEMNKPPLKSVLRSAFSGMKPIPVRRHE